jgi:UDP-N-acetylglucosamine 2-epimerase (non-hydrolysing)
MINPIILMVGTRPEGIKMAPVYHALKQAQLPVLLVSTGQHTTLLQEVFEVFNLKPDYDLALGRPHQDLAYLTQAVLSACTDLYHKLKPCLVMVQGDTTTVMASALAAFYERIPVAHIEAGLRTDSIAQPFPEEMNRRFLGMVAQYHFAPTQWSVANLVTEGIDRSNILCFGNTVVDTLRMMQRHLERQENLIDATLVGLVQGAQAAGKKLVLLTAHRRESFNGGIERILKTVQQLMADFPELSFIYPAHPNPYIQQVIEKVGIKNNPSCVVIEPLPYLDLIYVLDAVDIVMTDSGGIQEEAVSLGKHTLVLREKTERIEGVWKGIAHLVGTDSQALYDAMAGLLKSVPVYDQMPLYGDGRAAERIATFIAKKYGSSSSVQSIEDNNEDKKGSFMNTVCMVGLGYIGLPTALVAARAGFCVIGLDIDEQRVARINQGTLSIQEPFFEQKLQEAQRSGNFKATTLIESANYFVIAVPTPFTHDRKADLSYVFAAAKTIAQVLKQGDVVILESTVPVGTTKQLADYLAQQSGMAVGVHFFVAHCPERVLPGNIFHELVHNPRIIGGISPTCVEQAKLFYKRFVKGALYLTDAVTAEMVKLVENSSRDNAIAFANQVASMSYAAGLDPFEVIELANKHPRINILRPSCGVGGHCIAVDPWFLVQTFPEQAQLLKTAREINDAKPQEVLSFIRQRLDADGQSRQRPACVLVLGLTYKPDVDDLRESPALAIAQELNSWKDCMLLVCEPQVEREQLYPYFKQHQVVPLEQGIERADLIISLVAHSQFKILVHHRVRHKILDFCGLLHIPRQESPDQERLFWPASSMHTWSELAYNAVVQHRDSSSVKEQST